ncbi:MAG: hypothetical protein ABI165_16770 [Bryobacteraceae bacterium]
MKTTLALRIAAVITLLFCIGHMLGMPWVGSLNASQMAQIEAVKSIRAETMGFVRSYWDFHIGFGLIIAVNFLAQSVLFWQLATWAKSDASRIRPIAGLFALAYVAFILLGFVYLFWAPIVFSFAIAACLTTAWLTCKADRLLE